MSNTSEKPGLGWLPDFRDYTEEQEEINKVLRPLAS